jgi:hypothetical protein
MTSEARHILNQCKALGIIVEATPDGEHLDLHYQAPPPEELRQLLRAHKQEIISLLKPQPPLWHAQAIAKAVEKEGVCLFWSEVLGEVIGFVKDDSFKRPSPFVFYTAAELTELHQGKPTIRPQTLRLIHAAKKQGNGHISSREVEC